MIEKGREMQVVEGLEDIAVAVVDGGPAAVELGCGDGVDWTGWVGHYGDASAFVSCWEFGIYIDS